MSKFTNDGQTGAQNAPQPEKPYRDSRCECCHYSDIGGTHGESGYPLARGVVLCSFCKLLFPQIEVPHVDLSDAEFLGAWSDFTEDIGSFHLNVARQARSWRVEFDDLLPDGLHAHLVGSVIESAAQRNALAMLWPLLSRERVLCLIEVATVLADDYDHEPNLDTLHAVIEREEVAPVWLSWLAANAQKGKAPAQNKNRIVSQWASYGEAFIERSAERAASMAKSRIKAGAA
jgi:hypothetical protein